MRRTKDASLQTRQRILAAARAEFGRRGVTRTTLEHIARSAGVTRGAVYWHFANKAELFQAMRDRVILPLVDRTDFAPPASAGADALGVVEAFMLGVVASILKDREARETFEILNLKCEYVDELAHELASQVKRCGELTKTLTRHYQAAQDAGVLREGLEPEIAALETSAFLIGLFRIALICGPRTPVARRANELIAVHVTGRRAPCRSAGSKRSR